MIEKLKKSRNPFKKQMAFDPLEHANKIDELIDEITKIHGYLFMIGAGQGMAKITDDIAGDIKIEAGRMSKCFSCGYEKLLDKDEKFFNFCPNCGKAIKLKE